MSGLEIFWRQVGSFWYLFKIGHNSGDTASIIKMCDLQDPMIEEKRQEGKIQDLIELNQELKELWKTDYRTPKYDINALSKLSKNTLGYHYARHMLDNGLSPDFFEDRSPKNFTEFVRLRLRHSHDIYHSITGLGTGELDEIALQGWTFAQYANNSQAIMLFAAALLRSVLSRNYQKMIDFVGYFNRGYTSGKQAKNILAVKWENYWEIDIDEVRKELTIEALT